MTEKAAGADTGMQADGRRRWVLNGENGLVLPQRCRHCSGHGN